MDSSRIDEYALENTIDSLYHWHGIFGSERLKMLNQLVKSIADAMIPNFVKYLLQASTDERDLEINKNRKFSKYQLIEFFG